MEKPKEVSTLPEPGSRVDATKLGWTTQKDKAGRFYWPRVQIQPSVLLKRNIVTNIEILNIKSYTGMLLYFQFSINT